MLRSNIDVCSIEDCKTGSWELTSRIEAVNEDRVQVVITGLTQKAYQLLQAEPDEPESQPLNATEIKKRIRERLAAAIEEKVPDDIEERSRYRFGLRKHRQSPGVLDELLIDPDNKQTIRFRLEERHRTKINGKIDRELEETHELSPKVRIITEISGEVIRDAINKQLEVDSFTLAQTVYEKATQQTDESIKIEECDESVLDMLAAMADKKLMEPLQSALHQREDIMHDPMTFRLTGDLDKIAEVRSACDRYYRNIKTEQGVEANLQRAVNHVLLKFYLEPGENRPTASDITISAIYLAGGSLADTELRRHRSKAIEYLANAYRFSQEREWIIISPPSI